MSKIEFQTPEQGKRIRKLQDDLFYRLRVVAEVAEPLVDAKNAAKLALSKSLREIGVPEGAKFAIAADGVHYGSERAQWDEEKGEFVEPKDPEPAKRTARPRRGGGKK